MLDMKAAGAPAYVIFRQPYKSILCMSVCACVCFGVCVCVRKCVVVCVCLCSGFIFHCCCLRLECVCIPQHHVVIQESLMPPLF